MFSFIITSILSSKARCGQTAVSMVIKTETSSSAADVADYR